MGFRISRRVDLSPTPALHPKPSTVHPKPKNPKPKFGTCWDLRLVVLHFSREEEGSSQIPGLGYVGSTVLSAMVDIKNPA